MTFFVQGTLTEGEGTVQVISRLKLLVLLKGKNLFSVLKAADLNWLGKGSQLY